MSLRSGTIEKVRKRSMGANGTARFHRNQTTMSDKKRTIYIGNLDRRVTEYAERKGVRTKREGEGMRARRGEEEERENKKKQSERTQTHKERGNDGGGE
eukprot:1329225-Amorphochlora_amoeboformis.AAC.1